MCGIFAYKGSLIPFEELEKQFMKLQHRGPDNMQIDVDPQKKVFLGFHRLSIMDLTSKGNQPFVDGTIRLLCNGEIYNHESLKQEINYKCHSASDCEILLPLIEKFGLLETSKKLDAEFALIWYDHKTQKMMAARDPIGIRPLFWGKTTSGEIAFASEVKALVDICEFVEAFPPGFIWDGNELIEFSDAGCQPKKTLSGSEPMKEKEVLYGISYKLTEGVRKRMGADAPIGFLLSGGLDSSLICALAAKISDKPIKTFSVGSNIDAIDNKYAELVAKHIGAEHTTVLFTQQDATSRLDELIRKLETWDITTIRASVGMDFVCEWIHKNTNIKVLMTGEVSDELFGYKYTDYAPNATEFQNEAIKRMRELYIYDVLRADRCISGHSLESRVPFGDLNFVSHVMNIPAEMKMNTHGQGKYLLRKAFSNINLLPEEILYREKAAFSDAVGHSIVDGIKFYAETNISDKELLDAKQKYSYGTPLTKEALLYRNIFERHYPGRSELIKDFWLPNKNWENCNVTDPSARVLPNYGDSGK